MKSYANFVIIYICMCMGYACIVCRPIGVCMYVSRLCTCLYTCMHVFMYAGM